jgi:cyclic-di-AMP phosphodiesterase PgpH
MPNDTPSHRGPPFDAEQSADQPSLEQMADRLLERRPRRRSALNRWAVVRATCLGVALTAVMTLILLLDLFASDGVVLGPGDVSSQDILAPGDLTYESDLLTRKARDAQAASVPDVYDPPDDSVNRQQEVRLRQILDYVSTVRQDSYASREDKREWIAAIPDLNLAEEVIDRLLALGEADWQAVKEEAVRVLIRSMQGEIREDRVTAVRRGVPVLISYSLTPDQAQVVQAIVSPMVTANTFYDAARTEEARQQARDSVAPVTVSIRKGEALVRAGDLVTAEKIEALNAFGLRQQDIEWQAVVGTALFAALVVFCFELMIFRLQPALWMRGRASLVLFALVAVFVALSKLMLPAGDILAHFCPVPALSMIVTVLFGPVLGVAMGVLVGFTAVFVTSGSLEITVYVVAGTLMGALALGRGERIRSFLQAGVVVGLTNAVVIILFRLLRPEPDLIAALIDALAGMVMGGLAASLALAAFFAVSSLLDLVTPFQLMELSRPTQPLFRQLLLKAPGTYHHTLLVANMAEEAAERIGADGLLTRVGAYYHDIGKTVRPYFFIENRVGSVDPHERLDPKTSAQIIVSHVQDGLDLAKKHRLPAAIRAFIPEHQGTDLVLAFYRMAVKAADDGDSVREEDFCYPGPKPQSRETAIVMLADGCEARVRSAQPRSVEEIEEIITATIKSKMEQGQLDDSDLTLHDLSEIATAFLSVLQGVFHPRIKYPEPVKVKGAHGQEILR